MCNICVTLCVTFCVIFLKKMGALKNESIARLCLVYHRRWYQKLLMLFFSNLQNCNLENFFATSSFRSSRNFYFLWLNSRWNFIKKNINFFKKKCQKNKIKKWNSMWRLKKFSEGARRNFENFFNTTLNCCIKNTREKKGRSPFAQRRVIVKFDGGSGGLFKVVPEVFFFCVNLYLCN